MRKSAKIDLDRPTEPPERGYRIRYRPTTEEYVAAHSDDKRERKKALQKILRRQIEDLRLLEGIAYGLQRLELSGTIDAYTGQPRPMEDVQAISAALNVRLRLLNKILPDLKSVELESVEGGAGGGFTLIVKPPAGGEPAKRPGLQAKSPATYPWE